MAVVATLSKGYDLDYIWKNVDRGPVKDAASYYLQASESGGEPPGRWWGPGAEALGFQARVKVSSHRQCEHAVAEERQSGVGIAAPRRPRGVREDLPLQLDRELLQ